MDVAVINHEAVAGGVRMVLSNEKIMGLVAKHTDLGHAKRDRCVLRQMKLLISSPGTSLQQAAGKGQGSLADLVSSYRFMDNAKIRPADLRKIRAQTVLSAIEGCSDTMVVHDMTVLDFSSQNCKGDRRAIGNHRGKGYEYACCAAVDPESGEFQGVLHDTLINADGPDDVDTMDYDYEPLFADLSEKEQLQLRNNHKHQMAVHINGLASLLPDRRLIHVADREFDDIFVISRCIENGSDFVIRAIGNRNVHTPEEDWVPDDVPSARQPGHPLKPGWRCVNLSRLVEAVPLRPYKSLPLSKRGRVTDERSASRKAGLWIGACQVRLFRLAERNKRRFMPPCPLELNMVVIREADAPESVKALHWVLFTTLPVDTLEQMAYIGRTYELRWKIETYFKLLKSGYRVERSRFDDAVKTAKLLIMLSLAAMTLLDLKKKLGLPQGGYLDDESYDRLKQATRELDNPDIDLNLRLFAFIAKYGGWLARRNDPLGPAILMRGLLQVTAVFDALTRYGPLLQEAMKSPNIIKDFI